VAESDADRAPEPISEEELSRREAELELRERELRIAERATAVAAREKAAVPSSHRTPRTDVPAPPDPTAAPETAPTWVASGTELAVQLTGPITTKTAKVGDAVEARLASDLVVDGRLVARSGAVVEGSVTEVVSGSRKIGGTPTLGLRFERLELADGTKVAISGSLAQQGKSDTAKDSAKIAGATVAGAIIGHQIDSDKGKIIGGILGGAAGTAAAAKTGGEVEVPAGTVLGFKLDAPLEVI